MPGQPLDRGWGARCSSMGVGAGCGSGTHGEGTHQLWGTPFLRKDQDKDGPQVPHGEGEGPWGVGSKGCAMGGFAWSGSACPGTASGARDAGDPAQPQCPPVGSAPVPAARQLMELVVSLLGLRSRTAA